MIENPFSFPAPTDPVDRVHAFARDLAYGAVTKIWSTTLIAVFYGGRGRAAPDITSLWGVDELEDLLTRKWGNDIPSLDLLTSFGYMLTEESGAGQENYTLTDRAFALLARPAQVPSVFISYHRQASSTFGLLLECRLASVGVKAFIDRSLNVGESRHQQLHEKVRNSDRFICLLAPGTLHSPYVCEEVGWAKEANILTIPIWQPGFKPTETAHSNELRDWLVAKHSIRILEDSAEAYHNATESLLNQLGYS